MTDQALSTQQLAVIRALSSGATMAASADQAGVHRNTILNWRRNLLPFQHALANAQYDRALYFREKVEDLADLALQTVQAILTDPKAPAGVRLKAALAIIETAATPPPPKKQIELEIQKIQLAPEPPLHTDAQPPAVPPQPAVPGPTTPQTLHKDAQPPAVPPQPAVPGPTTPQNLHNDAQSPAEICAHPRSFAANSSPNSPAHPKVGRNDPCPCGSGRKFKRCCIDQPLAAAA